MTAAASATARPAAARSAATRSAATASAGGRSNKPVDIGKLKIQCSDAQGVIYFAMKDKIIVGYACVYVRAR